MNSFGPHKNLAGRRLSTTAQENTSAVICSNYPMINHRRSSDYVCMVYAVQVYLLCNIDILHGY